MCVGHTLGEEKMFVESDDQDIVRTESVVATKNSCVL